LKYAIILPPTLALLRLSSTSSTPAACHRQLNASAISRFYRLSQTMKMARRGAAWCDSAVRIYISKTSNLRANDFPTPTLDGDNAIVPLRPTYLMISEVDNSAGMMPSGDDKKLHSSPMTRIKRMVG